MIQTSARRAEHCALRGWFFAFVILACAPMANPACAGELALIPAPLSVETQDGAFALSRRTPIYVAPDDEGARLAALRLAELVERVRGLRLNVRAGAPSGDERAIVFARDPAIVGEEAYALHVTPTRVSISASGEAGLYYGATTLYQLTTQDSGRGAVHVPAVRIADAPRFQWRGLMLDSARHFQSVAFVKRFIDVMAMEKFNVLHWHLTDDQGWRIEIRKYPRLTEIGAWRRPSGAAGEETPRYGGFYNQAEIRDIVAYASARHITIVPEIEMPGHATAPIVAYPQLASTPNPPIAVSSDWGVFPNLYNVDDSTFTFLEDVLTEVMELFPGDFIHVGGDEAVKPQWEGNPAIQARMRELGLENEHELQNYFITRVGEFLNSRGRKMIGWDEILEGGIAPNAAIMSWRGVDGAIAAARLGHDTVLTPWPLLYFDNRQSAAPDEAPGRGYLLTAQGVYGFNPAPPELTEEQRAHIIGIQANIWTEHMRTDARVEAKAFPRAAAVAEVAWSAESRRDWASFSRRLSAELGRYDALGIGYDQPALNVMALARRAGLGRVEIALSTPAEWGEIRYTINGGVPTTRSQIYQGPLDVAIGARVRAQAFIDGRAVGAAQSWRFSADQIATRASQQLAHCGDSLQLNFEDDAPRAGPGSDRAVFNVDVMRPCWMYQGADFDGVTEIVAAVGQFPYSFQIGDSVRDITFNPPSTPEGELEVRLGACDGARIAVLPLARAADNPGVTTLRASLAAPIEGRHDVCFSFTAHGVDPMYAIDWVRIGPSAR